MRDSSKDYDGMLRLISRGLVFADIVVIVLIALILSSGVKAPYLLGMVLVFPLHASSVWFPMKIISDKINADD